MKIGPVDPEIALLNLKKKKENNASKTDSPSGKFAERAKLRKVKYIARSAGLPSGLNLGPVFPQQINLPLTDDLIDELPVEKGHLSKLIIICRIKLTGD